MELLDRLVGEARSREPQPMDRRERTVAGVSALFFLLSATGVALLLPHDRSVDPLVAAALVLTTAVLFRVRFEIGMVTAGAEQLAFVPMLFLVPPAIVPLLVAAGYLIARVPGFIRREIHPDRWIHACGDASFALGPALVIGLLAPGPPQLANVEVYVLAFIAQVAMGGIVAVGTDRLLYGISTREVLGTLLFVSRIDAVLSPIGFMIATVAVDEPLALLTIFPLVWLLSVFSRERRERYAAALELSRAYRGTVMVLADVVEAEDHYTASHSRSVVELSVAVADELGVDPDSRQELEIAALLHDVGKIVVPKEILNKPSALTDVEFEIMKTHTVEGQALLARVGGLLGRVGEIVRSCHERWDGAGYPDGLMGEEIPFAARVVFCCDAFSAMTTDRPYRKAMSEETALEEIRGNAGTQFDPRVVAAVLKIVKRGEVPVGETYTADAVRAVLAGHSLPASEVKTAG